jgi:hypothetical protein
MSNHRHSWAFRPRFRANAFGWKASKLASQRLKEALAEIRTVARKDPLTAADGAILLMEKLWPAVQHIDSSSGALGNAVSKTVHGLIEVMLAAPADDAWWERWLERLWTAFEEDGVDYLWEVNERSPVDIGTLLRAARDHLESDPPFAM